MSTLLLIVCGVWWTVTVDAQSCPSPCYCRPPGQVFCNGTGISEIPDNIPTDTKILYIGDNPIHEIKKGSLSKLVNLNALDASGARLKEGSIEPGALDLPSLTDVDLSMTDYTTIPKVLPKIMDTFRMMQGNLETIQSDSFNLYPRIVYLDLSNNKISKIQPGAFDPLVAMTTLYIGFNKLTDASFPPNAFSKCRSINSIDFRFNQMQSILNDIPTCIQHLCFVGNQIKTLPSFGFKDLVNLNSDLGFLAGTGRNHWGQCVPRPWQAYFTGFYAGPHQIYTDKQYLCRPLQCRYPLPRFKQYQPHRAGCSVSAEEYGVPVAPKQPVVYPKARGARHESPDQTKHSVHWFKSLELWLQFEVAERENGPRALRYSGSAPDCV